MNTQADASQIRWIDNQDQPAHARWRSMSDQPAPKRVYVVDDTVNADSAYKWACEGIGLLWCGDFQNAKLLMQAMERRVDSKAERAAAKAAKPGQAPASAHASFVAQRKAQAQRSRVLNMLLLPFDADHGVPLRRAPDVREAGAQARGAVDGPGEHYVASLRELQGLIGAHEWRKKGVHVGALKADIIPHYGVFSPLRGEYLDLVAHAPLPSSLKSSGKAGIAFDIGTGTGVLAALLAKRGVNHVVATDQDPRALACARENLAALGVAGRVELLEANLYPPGSSQAHLIVCNPPWLPWRPNSPLEHAVYDPDSRMLLGFLNQLAAHLLPGGEGWLIMSDLAEHLGLRSRDELLGWIAAAGLRVVDRSDVKPQHSRAKDKLDPLFKARSAELTSLWRLAAA
ncbi:class I SAM-dependent methyltransferase [Roseateles oligotrophus]|uniref:Class I SAM-dependent methyltransferase n=1 Tax=Roseateles oligotrophus TaxID=1769250 RepID=A0ABT2YKL5_9BURK|nr:class I SAM-dependent methyltransferase [Roseateles oligotrophus]MCV2370596.1 class I SAM-dependent methyltransferase [Roseateles oligotrophus]